MSDRDILDHCAEIDRCNQRGGRMLSIVDLIDAGTVTPELAAYALAAIGNGASFLVGALPGGAGKTTVMGALLNFVPRGVPLVPADGMAAIARGRSASRRSCFIGHEIGAGAYYAYLWDAELRAYFELADAGHMLATNLHADTYEQARDQMCRDNGVPPAHLRRMSLMFFLDVRRRGFDYHRRIAAVWESDGQHDHRQLPVAEPTGSLADASTLVTTDQLDRARRTLDAILQSDARTIEQVRAAVLEAGER